MTQVGTERNGLSRSREHHTHQVIRRENAALRRDLTREVVLGAQKSPGLGTNLFWRLEFDSGENSDEASETEVPAAGILPDVRLDRRCRKCYLPRMNAKLAQALSAITKLPTAEQERAAEALLDFALQQIRPTLSEEQAAEVQRRLQEPQPERMTLAEAKARIERRGA